MATVTTNRTNANPAPYSDADIQKAGLEQGVEVAQLEQGNAGFDMQGYAQNTVVPYLESQGLNDGQIQEYVASMESEFNYLTPTAQLSPNNSNVGNAIISQVLPNANEPGQAENPATTSPQTLVNQGTTLGQQLAAVQNTNSSNFDIAAYAQNLGNAMKQAGYNATQVDAFTSGVLMGYASALGGYLSQ